MLKNKRASVELYGALFMLFIALLIGGVNAFFNYGNETITSEKIVSADIEITGQGSSLSREKFLFTEENTYVFRDRIFVGATRSMDVYRDAKAHVGEVCDITTIGTRIGIFSKYKSVIELNCNTNK